MLSTSKRILSFVHGSGGVRVGVVRQSISIVPAVRLLVPSSSSIELGNYGVR